MSADNFVGVYERLPGEFFVLPDGCMSLLNENCQYVAQCDDNQENAPSDRASALMMAHDIANCIGVEYGVIELGPINTDYCGKCWVCVNERGIEADDVEHCDKCSKALVDSYTVTSDGSFCNGCAPALF